MIVRRKVDKTQNDEIGDKEVGKYKPVVVRVRKKQARKNEKRTGRGNGRRN